MHDVTLVPFAQRGTLTGCLRKVANLRNVARMSISSQGQRIPEWTVGDRLSKARDTAGLSQGDFADEVGMSRRSVVRYESGSYAKKSVLLLYAMRTGVPLEWLVSGEIGSPGPNDGLPHLDSNQEPTVLRLPSRLLRAA